MKIGRHQKVILRLPDLYHKSNFYYYFRAQNRFGISDWSQSDHIDLENVFKNQPVSLSQFGPIIGGTLAGLLLICVLMFLFALNIIKTSQEKKPILLGSTTGRVCKNPENSGTRLNFSRVFRF